MLLAVGLASSGIGLAPFSQIMWFQLHNCLENFPLFYNSNVGFFIKYCKFEVNLIKHSGLITNSSLKNLIWN